MKSRLVVGGNLQPRDDEIETSSATVRLQSVFLLLQLSCKLKMKLAAIDIKSAYLHANIRSRDLFGRLAKLLLELRPDWIQYLQRDGSMLFRIDKALYGLMEAARLWFLHLVALLTAHGFKHSQADKAVLLLRKGSKRLYVCLHVDDMLVAYNDVDMYNAFTHMLTSNLAGITKQESQSLSFLGTSIEIKGNTVSVSRPGYIANLISKYAVVSNASSPCAGSLFESIPTGDTLPAYALHSKIMELRYLDDVRPVIKFVCSVLTTCMSKPTVGLDQAANRVLQYLRGTIDKKLIFVAPDVVQLFAYVDASYCVDDTMSWYCVWVQLGTRNAPFHLKCGKIKAVCRSSTEAELFALNESISDVLHYIDLLADLMQTQDTVIVFEDNTAAITLLQEQDVNYSARSKHVKVKIDFFKSMIKEGKVRLEYIETARQRADFETARQRLS